MEPLNFSVVRWVKGADLEQLKELTNARISLVFDHFERPLLLFANQYTLSTFEEKHEDITLVEAWDIESELEEA